MYAIRRRTRPNYSKQSSAPYLASCTLDEGSSLDLRNGCQLSLQRWDDGCAHGHRESAPTIHVEMKWAIYPKVSKMLREKLARRTVIQQPGILFAKTNTRILSSYFCKEKRSFQQRNNYIYCFFFHFCYHPIKRCSTF